MPERLRQLLHQRADAVAVALLVLVLTAVLFPVVTGAACFHERDLSVYYYPTKNIVRDAWRSGELPLWNPRYHGGQPMAANPEYEVFYPPQLLILLPDYFLGYRLHILFHFYLAALGMYAFCRSLGLRPPSAFFGALAFSLGGPMLANVNLLPTFFVIAWTPLVLLFARRFLRAPNRRDFAIGALLLGVQGTVGEPVTLLQTWALVAAYAFVLALTRPRSWKPVVHGALFGIAGILVASVQLIPAADHAGDSVRKAGFSFETVTEWSTPPARIKELFFPGIHLRQWDGNEPRVKSFYNGRPAFLAEESVGVTAAIFLIAVLLLRPRRALLLAAGIAVSWLIAAGAHTPLWRMLYDAGLRSVRYPEKFTLLAFFLTVVLVTLFVDRLVQGDERARKTAFWCGLLWTIVVALIALNAARDLPALDETLTAPNAVVVSPARFWWDLALRGAIVTALVWCLARTSWRPYAVAALLLFVAVDLARFRDELAPTMPRTFFTQPPALEGVQGRIFHAADWEWYANDERALAYFADARRYWWMLRNGGFPNLPAAWGHELTLQQDIDETLLQHSADFLAALGQVRQRTGEWPPLFDAMAAVSYHAVLLPPPPDLATRNAAEVMPVQFLPSGHHPRAYFADAIEPIGGKHDFTAKIAAQPWSPRVAFVENDPFAPATGRIHDARQTFTRIHVDAEASGRALLVLAVTPHKYWHATIDGVAAPVRVVNLASMAIEVPAGRHRIELRYRNPLVITTGIISLLTIAVLLGLIVVRRRP